MKERKKRLFMKKNVCIAPVCRDTEALKSCVITLHCNDRCQSFWKMSIGEAVMSNFYVPSCVYITTDKNITNTKSQIKLSLYNVSKSLRVV